MNIPKIKIQFNVTYTTNNNNEILAVAKPIIQDRFIAGSFIYEDETGALVTKNINPAIFERIVGTGIAKYNTEDVYDLELGKQIARKKAIRSFYKKYYLAAKKNYEDILWEVIRRMEYVKAIKKRAKEINEEIINLIS